MAVVQSNDKLLKEPSGLILLKAISLLDVLEHVTTRSKLHGDAKKFICQEDLFELYDVGVKKPVMVQQLPLYVFCDLQALTAQLPSGGMLRCTCVGFSNAVAGSPFHHAL